MTVQDNWMIRTSRGMKAALEHSLFVLFYLIDSPDSPDTQVLRQKCQAAKTAIQAIQRELNQTEGLPAHPLAWTRQKLGEAFQTLTRFQEALGPDNPVPRHQLRRAAKVVRGLIRAQDGLVQLYLLTKKEDKA